MPPRDRITITAPAKVNFFLCVKAKREDGYHEIETLMHKLALGDLVHLRAGGTSVRLRCPGSDLPEDARNLAFRAAEAFLAHTESTVGVDITLEKRIPVAAGLGGGSSDAAAVLLGLSRLHGHPLSLPALQEVAVFLGADVPFFVADYPAAWATGIGEKLSPRPSAGEWWVLLVNPGFSVSTRWVYENFALTSAADPFILGREHVARCSPGRSSSPTPGVDTFHNDLESVTARHYPVIDEIKGKLLDYGAVAALMSGSGPTVFGLFRGEDAAAAARERLAGSYGKGVILTKTLA